MIVVTRKTSVQRRRPGAQLSWYEETIKRSNHINSGMTERQRYAVLQKNGGSCFPITRVCACVHVKLHAVCACLYTLCTVGLNCLQTVCVFANKHGNLKLKCACLQCVYLPLTVCVSKGKHSAFLLVRQREFKQITEEKSNHYAAQTLCFTHGKQVGT